MRFLKGFALGLLSFLLFLSLAAFGLVLTLNHTLLNPDFVVSGLNRLDISSLAEEFVRQQAPQQELPEEFRASLVRSITKLEPVIRKEVSATVYPIYYYVLGKSQKPNLALTLGNTVLSPHFAISVVNELDTSFLAKELLTQRLEELPEGTEYLGKYMDDAVARLQPWIKQQTAAAVPPVLDYLLGKSRRLSWGISTEPLKKSLKDTLKEAFLKSPPPQLSGMPPALIEPYFNEFYEEFVKTIPATLELDESLPGLQTMRAQIAQALAEAEAGLTQAKRYVGYIRIAFPSLMALVVILLLAIILISRQVRASARRIGITFLSSGALGYGGIFVTRDLVRSLIPQFGIPAPLQPLIPQLLDDMAVPLRWFSLGLLIVGIALIVVSHVYRSRQSFR